MKENIVMKFVYIPEYLDDSFFGQTGKDISKLVVSFAANFDTAEIKLESLTEYNLFCQSLFSTIKICKRTFISFTADDWICVKKVIDTYKLSENIFFRLAILASMHVKGNYVIMINEYSKLVFEPCCYSQTTSFFSFTVTEEILKMVEDFKSNFFFNVFRKNNPRNSRFVFVYRSIFFWYLKYGSIQKSDNEGNYRVTDKKTNWGHISFFSSNEFNKLIKNKNIGSTRSIAFSNIIAAYISEWEASQDGK